MKCAICGVEFPAITAGAYVSYSLALCSEECRKVYLAKLAKNPWEPEEKKPDLGHASVRSCKHTSVRTRFMPSINEWWTTCEDCGLVLEREAEG